jgi:hypothetical protein
MSGVEASDSLLDAMIDMVAQKRFIPGGRYLYSAGRDFHQVNNCLLLMAEDSREGWSDLLHKASMALMTGAGIGVVYSQVRPRGSIIRRTGGHATGPISLMKMLNECGRGIMQGGARRCLPADTWVTMSDLTRKAIKDIQVGDLVLTRHGPRAVTNVFDQGEQDVIRITTEYGEVYSTANHRWLSSNSSRSKTFSVTADRLTLAHKLYYHPSAMPEIPADIVSVTTAGKVATFDIEVEGVHEFIADDFVSHNSAIWAGLHWNHQDIFEFIHLKDWSKEVRRMKAKDYNFPAAMDGTNISIILDDAFFEAYYNATHPQHELARRVYWETVHNMVSTGEPGFSIDVDDNAGEHLRNAPVTAGTNVLTEYGYLPVGDIVGKPVSVWTGNQWAPNVVFQTTGYDVPVVAVEMTGGRVIRCEPSHPFLVERYEGAGVRRTLVAIERVAAGDLQPGDTLRVLLPHDQESGSFFTEAYTLGYIYGDGSFHKNGGADLTLCTPESKDCLPFLSGYRSCNNNDSRGFTRLYFGASPYWKGRRKDIFPNLPPYVNGYFQSFLAGLFDADGNYEPTQKRIRLASVHEEFLHGVRRALEQLGILSHVSKAGTSTYGKSQGYQLVVAAEYNSRFAEIIPTKRIKPEPHTAYRQSSVKVVSVEPDGSEDVYCADVKVAEHCFQAEGVLISNCTEITSRDDSDVCNLGSLVLPNAADTQLFSETVYLAQGLLLAGGIYSHVPYDKVAEIRDLNRRTGLGIMGLHEQLLKWGQRYGDTSTLQHYMAAYRDQSDAAAVHFAKLYGINVPIAKRAIAPNGTISIVAETTGGCEPILAAAQKRRFLKGDKWAYQYIIDPSAKRLIDAGVDPDDIEDAYSIEPERRIDFQVFLQQYVDHGVSSTINLPPWGSELNNETTVTAFGEMLIKRLPRLRGITTYPDGARGGQPLNPIGVKYAMRHLGKTIYEGGDPEDEMPEAVVEGSNICDITGGGSCSS